jgi:Arc/MetJ-type ribon-helix-helix transcriptional regulator
MATARVTITLPAEVVEGIDRLDRNRSKFILQAVRRELARRRREALRRSLRNPHPEAEALAAIGLEAWARRLPEDDPRGLVDLKRGRPIRWVPGRGWASH